tara:strand:- start:79 stop:462 length:384 start_codon:yes stop_codon:yes gene_type:complete
MKINEKTPPRNFLVGTNEKFFMKDCGDIFLNDDELLTFKTTSGTEYDFSRKSWGYYATPSMNGRLENFNLRTCLIRNKKSNRYFILIVEKGHEDEFNKYLDQESCELVTWMDSTYELDKIRQLINEG